MYCPSCGNMAAEDQKFCRSCGMNLQKVAPALAEHLAEIVSCQSESATDIRRLAVRRVMWGATLLFSGIAIGIVGELIAHDETVRGAGSLISIVGIFWIVYSALSAIYRLTFTERRLPGESKLSEAKTTDQLLPERLGQLTPSSIAERTTDLLGNAPYQPADGKRSDGLSA